MLSVRHRIGLFTSKHHRVLFDILKANESQFFCVLWVNFYYGMFPWTSLM